MSVDQRDALSGAMQLIESQAHEIQSYKDASEFSLEIQEAMQIELSEMEEKISTLETLLHQTDEGLSEALIVLGAMRDGLQRVNEAAEKTVKSLNVPHAAPSLSENLETLSKTVSETKDDEMFAVHEDYLKDLRKKLGK